MRQRSRMIRSFVVTGVVALALVIPTAAPAAGPFSTYQAPTTDQYGGGGNQGGGNPGGGNPGGGNPGGGNPGGGNQGGGNQGGGNPKPKPKPKPKSNNGGGRLGEGGAGGNNGGGRLGEGGSGGVAPTNSSLGTNGKLPFTGFDLMTMVLLALGLVASGLVLRAFRRLPDRS